MEPARLTMPRKRLHPIYVASLAACAGLAGCATRTSDASLGSSEGGSTETSETTESSDTADVADGTDLGGASDTSGVPDPFDDAAEKACAVYNGPQLPVMIPSGDPPYQETGFRLGNEFPHRFIVDTTFVPLDLENVPDGFVCYVVAPGQNDGQEWWFSDLDWRDEDGEIRVYMATQGVEDVLYCSLVPNHYQPTYTGSIEFDASSSCPELPRVWTPDPADLPEEGYIICILPTSDEAEFVFVRVP